jgi:hypothetical protein
MVDYDLSSHVKIKKEEEGEKEKRESQYNAITTVKLTDGPKL